MRKVILLITVSISILSCSKSDSIIDCNHALRVLKAKTLNGHVKTLTEFESNVYNSIDFRNKKLLLKKRSGYSVDGNLIYKIGTDIRGIKRDSTRYHYDQNGFCIKTETFNLIDNTEHVSISEFDSLGNEISITHSKNDSVYYWIFNQYDAYKNYTKQIHIGHGDTSITETNYAYNDFGCIVYEKRIDYKTSDKNREFDFISEVHIKYDKNENLTELTKKDDYSGKSISKYYYNNLNRLTRITYSDTTGNISSDDFFDKFENLIHSKSYKNDTISIEMRHEYIYDDNDNWIEQLTYRKDLNREIFNDRPIYLKRREIEYYD